jgi:hypothetical protein
MSLYVARGTQTAAAKTALGIVSTAAVRPRVKQLKGSNIGTVSVDSEVEVQCSRTTTAGTSTAVTPAPTDPNDPASTFTAGSNHSAEPTYTASTLLASLIFNPRGQAIWQAYDPAAEIILPATASNGLGALLNTLGGATTVVVEATVQQ